MSIEPKPTTSASKADKNKSPKVPVSKSEPAPVEKAAGTPSAKAKKKAASKKAAVAQTSGDKQVTPQQQKTAAAPTLSLTDKTDNTSTDNMHKKASTRHESGSKAEREPAQSPAQVPAETPALIEEQSDLFHNPTPEEKPAEAQPVEPMQQDGRPLHQVFMREGIPNMYVVHITTELSPVAKVGGLADVVFGLARETEIRGNDVEIILPKYNNMRYDHIYGLQPTFHDLWVPWYNGAIHCTVYFGFVHGRKCFFIEPHSQDAFFERNKYYGDNDDVFRFAFFSRAAMEFLLKSGKRPDIIHCHDWQTGLCPVFQWDIYAHLGMGHCRVVYTIHNFRHQGRCGDWLLPAIGLHDKGYYFDQRRLGDNTYPTALNLMKGGIVYSNFVTTVSPTHAGEAKLDQGFGLEHTLHTHHSKYGGVLNGIDYDAWNPESDHYIPAHFNADNIEQKYDNKKALRERLWMADNEKPIVAYIGRLDPQKGLELVRHALFYCVNHGAQFVMLGSSPEKAIDDYFWHLKHHINDNVDSHIEVGFNMELAHLIYAGADMMIVPSQYEPCGLTQLIAMRYGSVPIVRSVGGLADTVFDKDYSHKPLHERNGYVFHDFDYGGIESALSRAISCYYQYPEHFRNLMLNGMRTDYSWNVPGQHYLNIYDYVRAK